MEQLLIVAVQFLTEVVGSAVVSIPFDFGRKKPVQPESASRASYIIFFVIGGTIGWMSAQLVTHTLLQQPWLRILNLAVAPLVAGIIVKKIAIVRAKTHIFIEPTVHFWSAFWFTLSFAVIRFAYVSH